MNIPLNIDFQQIMLHLFNFTILFAILYFLLYAPVKRFMEERQSYFKALDDEAKESVREANELKAEYEEKLRGAQEEAAELKKAAQKKAEEASWLKINQTRAEADRIIREAKASIEADRRKMTAEARNGISDIVLSSVEKIVLSEDTKTAIDEFLDAAKRGEA